MLSLSWIRLRFCLIQALLFKSPSVATFISLELGFEISNCSIMHFNITN